LKSPSGAARAQIVAPEFLDQLDLATDETLAALDMSFGREGFPPLTRDAESREGFRNRDPCAWDPPSKSRPRKRCGRARFYHDAGFAGK